MCDMLRDEIKEHLLCIATNCIDYNEQDKFKLGCSDCKRLIHCKCSKLLGYQIQSLLDIKKKKKQENKGKSNC